MNARVALLTGVGILLLVGAGVAWNLAETGIALDMVAEQADPNLPIPPLPPRLGDGAQYDRCLAQVPDDPQRAAAEARAWRDAGAGGPA